MSKPEPPAIPDLSPYAAAELVRLSRACIDLNHSEFVGGKTFDELNRRRHLAIASFFLCHEHHRAVVGLYDNDMEGAALALLRPCFEALARGIWLLRGSEEHQIQFFVDGYDTLDPEQLLIQVRKTPEGAKDAFLEDTWKASKRYLHQFTHVTYQLLVRRMPWDEVPDPRDQGEMARALVFASGCAMLATIELARLAGDLGLAQRASNLLQYLYPPLPEAEAAPGAGPMRPGIEVTETDLIPARTTGA